MTNENDNIGDTLREFYAMFGIPDEGPPEEFNVTALISVGRMLEYGNFDDKLYDKADELLKKVPEAIDEIEKVIKGKNRFIAGSKNCRIMAVL